MKKQLAVLLLILLIVICIFSIANIYSGGNDSTELITTVINKQKQLKQELVQDIKQFKKEGNFVVFMGILMITFLYGLIHAIGPGHGKLIIFSYFLSQKRPRILQGISFGVILAYGQALSAFIIVFGIYYLALGRIQSSFNKAELALKTISFLFLIILGGYFVLRKIRTIWQKQNSLTKKKKTKQLISPLLLSIIPCPGVMMVLVFAIALKLQAIGFLMMLSMATGMAVTITSIGILTILFKNRFVSLIQNSDRYQNLHDLMEFIGAVLLLSIGIFLLVTLYIN